MKRILAMLLAALMLCFVFVACDEEPAPETPTALPTTEEPTEEPTEKPTEEPTTDDGEPDPVDYYVDVWETDEQTPQAITATHKGVGITVTIPEGGYLNEVSVPCPSYSDDVGTLKLKVYAWDTDFDTTIAKDPIQVDEFVDFVDNSNLIATYDEGVVGSGTFLILVCDAEDASGSGVGVWMGNVVKDDEYLKEDIDKYGITSYVNGRYNKKKIGKFSLIITVLED